MRDQVLTLAEAIRKMTSFAAGVIGIDDRGVIGEGMRADLLVFDPAGVRETATFPAPLSLAEGFDVVIVNGGIARENGVLAGRQKGRVLEPSD